MNSPLATELRLRTTSRLLQVTFADSQVYELPFEYLRVYSPSAEVQGHGPGQEVLVTGKAGVGIRAVEPVGQYAVKLVFDEGRDYADNWARYQARVVASTAGGGGGA
jgi:DUF971 family protein